MSFNPIYIDYGAPNATPLMKDSQTSDLAEIIKQLKAGGGSDQPELLSALGVNDITQKQSAPTPESAEKPGSGDVGSSLIYAGGKALGTIAEQSALNEMAKAKLAQESALEQGRSTRSAMGRASASTHNALAKLMASYRSASQ